MSMRSQWRALAWGAGVAAVGAAIADVLAGGPWAAAGAAAGAVAGVFASSVYDTIRGKDAAREAWLGTLEKTPPQSWARLLDPRLELVGFMGRQNELATLVTWCKDNHASRLRLVTGPGGVGKTRLTVELAARLKEEGWQSERVADGKEGEAIATLRAITRRPTLLIVDYAETRVKLKQMLIDLASDRGGAVRVLLVARSAGDWWNQLGVGEPAVWDQVREAGSAELALSAAVDADLSDVEIIELGVRSFAEKLDLPQRKVEICGDSGEMQRRVLDLHAAALVAVLDDAETEMVRIDMRTVLGELLRHEQHFWYESAQACGLPGGPEGTTTRLLRQLVAAACLLGAANRDEAHQLSSRVPGMSPSSKITEWLRNLYPPDPNPGQTDWIGSLQPDRLAELHTLQELAASAELAQACLTDVDPRQARRAVTLLARASSDYPDAEILLKQTLPNVADLIADMQAPAETLATILNAIPYPTVILAPTAVAIGQRLTSDPPAGTDPTVQAYWLDNLGLRLYELGRPTESLPVMEEAATMYRELAAANPDRYRPHHARSLTNLGAVLSELGRPAEALSATEQAVTIRRELAAISPADHLPDLASSLNNLGVWLFQLGRPGEALQVTEEAVVILRKLTVVSPDSHRPDLASSLNNLALRLYEQGRPAEALPLIEQAVTIRRELAATNPDRHQPDLGRHLNNLGILLSQLGRPAEAVSADEEAVSIRRELAATNPGRYRPHLSESLNNLGIRFSELGRPADALPIAEEAVTMYRELAATNPDRYRPDLARSLNNLAARLSELGRQADALPIAEEAITIQRELATALTARHDSELADSAGIVDGE